MALDYFRRTKPRLKYIKTLPLLWSLTGNLLAFLKAGRWKMAGSTLRAMWLIASGRNVLYRTKNKKPHFDPSEDVYHDPYIPCRPWEKEEWPRKILAIRLQATGDTVITLPYLQDLHRHLPPSVKLDMLTRKETDDVPRNIYLFDKVFSIGGKRNFKKQVLFTFLLLPRLLMQRYDVIIDLQNNLISHIVRKALRPRAWSVFDKSSPRAAGERTRLTIEAAGIGANKMDTDFRLKDTMKGKNILLNNGWDGKSQLVVLNPAAAFETRHWPLFYYVEFARLWKEWDPHTQFIALGTDFIAAKTKFLFGELEHDLINLVGNTGPSDAFAVLQHVTLVLSEDSGLMHMAWVSGVPTLALFGGTRSDWARPLGRHTRFLDSSDLPCGNCMLEVCPYGDVHCLTRYTPERVLEEALALLESLFASKELKGES
jgi:ADP-heptose:LPS heptosyltransferase